MVWEGGARVPFLLLFSPSASLRLRLARFTGIISERARITTDKLCGALCHETQ